MKRARRRVVGLSQMVFYSCVCLFSKRPIAGGAGPVVCLTSFGERVKWAHVTIASIALGEVQPSRLILWLAHEDQEKSHSIFLRALRRRGLEIHGCEDFGPHKKYYPYVEQFDVGASALVTADDDVVYPKWWLAGLARAYLRNPETVWAYRARRVTFDRAGGLSAYEDWQFSSNPGPSCANFATGNGGVLYPPRVLLGLKALGRRFDPTYRNVDDIWLHHTEVRLGVRTALVLGGSCSFPSVTTTQRKALKLVNVGSGGNDEALARLYDEDDLALLEQEVLM